jgi:hypothetical protein
LQLWDSIGFPILEVKRKTTTTGIQANLVTISYLDPTGIFSLFQQQPELFEKVNLMLSLPSFKFLIDWA